MKYSNLRNNNGTNLMKIYCKSRNNNFNNNNYLRKNTLNKSYLTTVP